VRLAAIAVLAALAAAFLLAHPPAQAKPEVTYFFPDEGAAFSQPPPVVRFCFAEPVNVRDLNAGGDFAFRVVKPDGGGLGLRIVFRPDGLGVDIHLGLRDISPDSYQGEWQLAWRVTDAYPGDRVAPTPPADLEATEGTLKFSVAPDGEAPPETDKDIPQACGDDETPPADTSSGDDGDDNTVLIIGIALGAAALALGGGGLFLLSRRRAAWRRPPAGGGGTEGGS
jgi:hypothetical protein